MAAGLSDAGCFSLKGEEKGSGKGEGFGAFSNLAPAQNETWFISV